MVLSKLEVVLDNTSQAILPALLDGFENKRGKKHLVEHVFKGDSLLTISSEGDVYFLGKLCQAAKEHPKQKYNNLLEKLKFIYNTYWLIQGKEHKCL